MRTLVSTGSSLTAFQNCLLRFSVATLFRFVARFARGRIEDSSFKRFALNGIQRDFFGGFFPGGFLSGGFYPDTLINVPGARYIFIVCDKFYDHSTYRILSVLLTLGS